MDALTIFSTAILFAALVSYRVAWTPPTPAAGDSIRIESQAGRVFTDGFSRRISGVAKYIVSAHLLAEIYGLWATAKQPAFGLSPICPLAAGSNAPAGIYPTHQLSPQNILALSLIIFGGLTRGSCHRRLGNMFTWETSILKSHKLITNGPYRFVRHPAYTGLICVSIGYISFLLSPGTLGRECFIGGASPPQINERSFAGILYTLWMIVHYTDTNIFLVRRSFEEDTLLKREFGKDWDQWARSVRWNVIPFII